MASYILMLQADTDDQYITESALAEINPSLTIKYLQDIDEMKIYIDEAGEPALILLNDTGDLADREKMLRRLKADPVYGHIPVVVLGEKSSPEYIKKCYRAGANTFITKPSSSDAIKKKIHTFLLYWFEVAEV